MQYDLCLIKLLLNLHYTIGLLRILIFIDVFFELRESESGIRVGKGGAWVARKEFVDDFRKQLMCDKCWVIWIADDDASHTFSTAVGVESVGYKRESAHERTYEEVRGGWMSDLGNSRDACNGSHTFLFDVLPLAGLCSFGDRFAKQRHELAIAEAQTGRQWGGNMQSLRILLLVSSES